MYFLLSKVTKSITIIMRDMFQLLGALSKLFCFLEYPNEMFLFLGSYFTEKEIEGLRVKELKNGGVGIWTQSHLTSKLVLFLIMIEIFMKIYW